MTDISTPGADAKGGKGLVDGHEDELPGPVTSAIKQVEHLADAVDDLVPVEDDPANRVLVDNARLVRWAAPLFGVCAIVLLPWIVIAGTTLPARQLSRNYNVAWAGYDVLLLAGLTLTALATLRRSQALPLVAAATGALLSADAWFDVLTSPGGWDLGQAVAMSLFAELPLAFICFWLAWHSQAVAEQRLVLLLRRRGIGGRATRGADRAD